MTTFVGAGKQRGLEVAKTCGNAIDANSIDIHSSLNRHNVDGDASQDDFWGAGVLELPMHAVELVAVLIVAVEMLKSTVHYVDCTTEKSYTLRERERERREWGGSSSLLKCDVPTHVSEGVGLGLYVLNSQLIFTPRAGRQYMSCCSR